MFKLTHPLPNKYWVAVSGGMDSMAVLNWLNKPSRRESLLGVMHVNHMTGFFANDAAQLVRLWCEQLNIKVKYLLLEEQPPQGESKEAWWRDRRYEFFHSVNEPVILAHNFNDCLEEYIMCTMVRGYQATIPYANKNCVRPFRLWKRADIENFMKWYGFPWEEDPSNQDTKYKRNFIRHEIVPKVLELNPGVFNIVERLIREQ